MISLQLADHLLQPCDGGEVGILSSDEGRRRLALEENDVVLESLESVGSSQRRVDRHCLTVGEKASQGIPAVAEGLGGSRELLLAHLGLSKAVVRGR